MSQPADAGRLRRRRLLSGTRVATALAVSAALAVTASASSQALVGNNRRGATATTSMASGPRGAITTSPTTARSSATKYEQAVDAAASRGLQVWLEADLAKRWLQGTASFDQGIHSLGQLASRPGVYGIKVADELGYHGAFTSSPSQVLAFLAATRQALATAAPGKRILVDFVVPDLGCAGPGRQVCITANDARYPALALPALDKIFQSGDIDTADISTGLLDESTYAAEGTTAEQVQSAAWTEIQRRRWDTKVQLQGRKALAHPGVYQGGSAGAAASTHLFVDLPLSGGARAVDIWAWRQMYQGQIVRLMDPRLVPNALWSDLVNTKARGDQLFTHFSPSSVEVGIDPDLTVLAQAFTAVFVAAGIG